MISWNWKIGEVAGILGTLGVLAGGVLACGGGGPNKGSASGCDGLAACCKSLAGGEAQACQAVVMNSAVTEADCNQELQSLHGVGVCGGGGGGGSGGSSGSGGSAGSGSDGGTSSDSGTSPEASATGCAALSACCPSLPVFEDPMACLTVAAEGTTTACEESLASYESAGYCKPPVPDGGLGYGCFAMEATGSSAACFFVASTMPGFTCPTSPPGEKPGSCPTGGLVGCCVRKVAASEYSETIAACYYDSSVAAAGMSGCSTAGGTWTTTTP